MVVCVGIAIFCVLVLVTYTAHELAHLSPIAQALKTCADELSPKAQALKICADELPPIAHASKTCVAHVARRSATVSGSVRDIEFLKSHGSGQVMTREKRVTRGSDQHDTRSVLRWPTGRTRVSGSRIRRLKCFPLSYPPSLVSILNIIPLLVSCSNINTPPNPCTSYYACPHPSIPTTARSYMAAGHQNEYKIVCEMPTHGPDPRVEPSGQNKWSGGLR